MVYDEDSDPIGVIEGVQGSFIRLEDWVAWIAGDSRMCPPEPVRSVNPINREPLIIEPHPGTAYVVENGSRIGMMSWSEQGLHEIVVYGASPQVIALAEEVAQQLGGSFRHLDVG